VQAFVFAADGSTVGFEENYTEAVDCFRLAIEVSTPRTPRDTRTRLTIGETGGGTAVSAAGQRAASGRAVQRARQPTAGTSRPAVLAATAVPPWVRYHREGPRGPSCVCAPMQERPCGPFGLCAPMQRRPLLLKRRGWCGESQALGRLDEAVANYSAAVAVLTRHQVAPLQRMHTLKIILAHQLQLRMPSPRTDHASASTWP
jgi:hypothetical protein